MTPLSFGISNYCIHINHYWHPLRGISTLPTWVTGWTLFCSNICQLLLALTVLSLCSAYVLFQVYMTLYSDIQLFSYVQYMFILYHYISSYPIDSSLVSVQVCMTLYLVIQFIYHMLILCPPFKLYVHAFMFFSYMLISFSDHILSTFKVLIAYSLCAILSHNIGSNA